MSIFAICVIEKLCLLGGVTHQPLLKGLTELLHDPQELLIYYSTFDTCNQEYSRGCQTVEMVDINEALLLLS